MNQNFFVYILKSLKDPAKSYIGFTRNINRRIEEHNSGTQTYSKRYAPWKIETYVVFSDIRKALAFEKYLKAGSGKAFVNNHF